MKKMKIPLSILIIIMWMVMAVESDPQNCSFCLQTPEGCTLCFRNCTFFTFVSCTEEDQLINQQTCIDNCCQGSLEQNTFDNFVVSLCMAYDHIQSTNSNTNIQNVQEIVLIVAGCAVFGIVLFLSVRSIYRRCRYGSRIIPIHRPAIITSNSFIGDDNSLQDIQPVREYPANYKSIIEDTTNTCCICLDGNLNAVTRCGHPFHLSCLASWMTRKNCCPLCNSKDAHDAKYFCAGCKIEKAELSLRKCSVVEVEKLGKQKCESCGFLTIKH